jgi:Histone methyltransferase Tudor domain 1
VKFAKSNAPSKTLTGKHIAYDEPAMFQFEVGSRVIAIFHNPEEPDQKKYLYYAGIIAEGMKVTNNYRYDLLIEKVVF